MVANYQSIPSWDARGLLPPYLGDAGRSEGRSPYRIALVDMVTRFGNTAVRRLLMSRFLDFRSALHQAGLVHGFQWVNGSFVTDIMWIENREPHDIDVVTFPYLPEGHTQVTFRQAHPDLFNRERNRTAYRTDALYQVLDSGDIRYLANRFAYYSSLWSHTPQWAWKGFLELDLENDEDATARLALDQLIAEEAAG